MSELSPFLPGFAAAYAILLVAASSPGPAVAMLLGISMAQGRAPALMVTGDASRERVVEAIDAALEEALGHDGPSLVEIVADAALV